MRKEFRNPRFHIHYFFFHRINWILFVGIVAIMGCRSNWPQRPTKVPENAIWAGGPDGGAWISCKLATKEPFIEYDCQIYDENGTLCADGAYILATINKTPITGIANFRSINSFNAYDGENIYITSKKMLTPHLWIRYPFSAEHGRKIFYDKGIQKEEIEY